MIIGDKEVFAIECSILQKHSERWIFGSFYFWIRGCPIGKKDDTVDLTGVTSWVNGLVTEEINRYEPELWSYSQEKAFNHLYFEIYETECDMQKWDNAYGRFDISHVGMSAFDGVYIFLLENKQQQRVLWKEINGKEIYEAVLPAKEIQQVGGLSIIWYTSESSKT